ncbi:MAG: alpha/beta hydrolase [Cryobacterium sp.]|nr:alpha/beta hydrolase [Oligoflexia bacterium]
MILHTFRYPRREATSQKNSETSPATGRPKLLFLHGMGGNGSLWRPVAAALDDDADILAPDQRGHGGSLPPASETGYSPLDYAKDVAETCAAESFSPAWVVGHSMGVRTACGYAKLSPGSVLGLILVDLGFSGLAGGGIGDALKVFLKDLPNHFPTRAAAKEFLAVRCPDPAIAQYLLAVARVHLKDGSITFPFDQSALLKTIEDSRGVAVGPWMEEFARETGKPVYILRGERSEVYVRSDFEADQKRYASLPNIHFLEMAGTGHGMPFEKRLDFVALIRKWVDLPAKT